MAPKPKSTTKRAKSSQLDDRPVRFTASVGILWVKPSRHEMNPVSGIPTPVPGLRVVFNANGDDDAAPVGGVSREFLPTEDSHDADSENCDCKHCLQAVRDFIVDRRNRDVVAKHHVREVDPDAGVKLPFAKWDGDLSVDELGDIHKSIGFDLEEALRYERKNLNRAGVIDKIEELIADGATVSVDDVLAAEVELD